MSTTITLYLTNNKSRNAVMKDANSLTSDFLANADEDDSYAVDSTRSIYHAIDETLDGAVHAAELSITVSNLDSQSNDRELTEFLIKELCSNSNRANKNAPGAEAYSNSLLTEGSIFEVGED